MRKTWNFIPRAARHQWRVFTWTVASRDCVLEEALQPSIARAASPELRWGDQAEAAAVIPKSKDSGLTPAVAVRWERKDPHKGVTGYMWGIRDSKEGRSRCHPPGQKFSGKMWRGPVWGTISLGGLWSIEELMGI